MTSRFLRGLLVVLVAQASSLAFCCVVLAGQVAERSARQDSPAGEVRLGKFEILAAYSYARALRDGLPDREAKERGIVAAVMGARNRGIRRGGRSQRGSSSSQLAPGTTKKTLTAESYDAQVRNKLQPFHDSVFLPAMKKLVAARLSYDQVKKLLEVPPAIGAKITSEQFTRRASSYLQQMGKP